MRALKPENLDHWISSWKRAVKEPEELLLGMGVFVNVVQAALGELERRYHVYDNKRVARGRNTWESRVLGLLEAGFEAGAPTVELWRSEHGGEMVDELERSLRGGTDYDVELIYPLLKKVGTSPAPLVLEHALFEELLSEGDSFRLAIFARLIARRSLEGWDADHLKDLPKKTLAQTFVSLLLGSRANDVGRGVSDAEVRAVWQSILCGSAESRPPLPTGPVSLLDAFGDDGYWQRLAYRFLEGLGRTWAEILRAGYPERESTSGATGHDAIPALEEADLQELGRKVISGYAKALLERVLHVVGRSKENELVDAAGELGRQLHDKLAAAGVFAKGRHSWGETYDDVVARVAVLSVIDASVRHNCKELADRVAAETTEPELEAVGRWLHERMIQETFEDTWPDVQQACAEVLARQDVQMELGTVLSPVAERVFTLVDEAAESDIGDADGEQTARFWEQWKESFAREFGLFEYLPWDTVDEEDLRFLLGEMVQRLTGSLGEWDAFFRVEGLDLADSPEGPVLRVGSVALYDPEIYNFGEGRFKLWDKGVGGPYVVAKATVKADSPAAAERVGLRVLADALNVLTFAYADSQRKLGGLKGEVLPGALLTRRDGSLSQYRPRLGGARTPAVLRTKDRTIGVYAGAYRGLLEETRDEGGPGQDARGRIRPGFLKGVHWYARGLWESDPLQRFLAHWIGLEHLFVSGESKKTIVDEVPKLTVTWRTLRQMFFTGMTLQELVHQAKTVAGLKAKAARRPDLAGWDEDARVLLNPAKVKEFALLAAGPDPALAQRLENFVDELRELAHDNEAIDADVEAMREHESFKLLVLNNVRNKVVHEAVRDVPGIEAYADKVEKLLGDVLEKLVGDAVEADPENEYVKDLMARHAQQPWLEGRRGMRVTEEVLERLLSVGKDNSDGGCFEDDSADLLDEARAKRAEAL